MLAALASACAPEIGDPCENSVDCDIQNKRTCDLTLPGGYCTISGCEKGTCPDEAVCVAFRPEPDRLSNSWCMASCDDNSDCRDGYRCRRAEQLGMIPISANSEQTGEINVKLRPLAQSLDRDSAKFCTVRVPAPAIGDACESALGCNFVDEGVCDTALTDNGYCTVTSCEPGSCPEGKRVCDTALHEDGYCTVIGCEPGECPDRAVCVRFDPGIEGEPLERCMASCIDDLDCREDYQCLEAAQLQGRAESLDRERARFCTPAQQE